MVLRTGGLLFWRRTGLHSISPGALRSGEGSPPLKKKKKRKRKKEKERKKKKRNKRRKEIKGILKEIKEIREKEKKKERQDRRRSSYVQGLERKVVVC
jgi:hypothetical protein